MVTKQKQYYKNDVFVSYSHRDSQFVDTHIVPLFNQHSIRYFLDRKDLELGNLHAPQIHAELELSNRFLIFLSEQAVRSRWVDLELNWAIEARAETGKLLPVILPSVNLERLKEDLKPKLMRRIYLALDDGPNRAQLDMLIKAIKGNRDMSEFYVSSARNFLRRNMFANCIDHCNLALRIERQCFEALTIRAEAVFREHRLAEFVAEKTAVVHDGTAEAQLSTKVLQGALRDLNLSLAINRNQTDAKLLRGLLQNNLDNPKLAELDLEEVVKSEPKNVRAWRGLAIARFQLRDTSKALEACNQGLVLEPHNARLNQLKGQLLLAAGDCGEAKIYLLKALQDGIEDQAGTYLHLAMAHEELSEWADAEEALTRATCLAPESIRYWFRLASLLHRRNEWVKAIDASDRALQLDPRHVGSIVIKGICLLRLRRVSEASDLSEAVWNSEKTISTLILRAECLHAVGESAKALRLATRATEKHSCARLFELLGRIYRDLGQSDEAKNWEKEAARLHGLRPENWLLSVFKDLILMGNVLRPADRVAIQGNGCSAGCCGNAARRR